MGRSDMDQPQSSVTGDKTDSRRYPTGLRKKPNHLKDLKDEDSNGVHITVDYCCRVTCGVLLEKAAHENLIIHQMDVKTAYLHAPINFEIIINPP